MFIQLQEQEIGQHIHDLAKVGMCDKRNYPETEECIKIFIRTFADDDMREDYERLWNKFDVGPPEWPGCAGNCHCRN